MVTRLSSGRASSSSSIWLTSGSDGSVAVEAAGCEALVAPAYSAIAERAGTFVSTLPPLTVTVLEQSIVAYTSQYSPSARDVV